MESYAMSAAFEGMTLGLPPPTLHFQGGTVEVKLSNQMEDVLILHKSVLAKASERFAMRFNSRHWAPSREADVGGHQGKVRVYEYRLIHADGTYTLTDEKEDRPEEPEERERDPMMVRAMASRGGLRGRGGRGGGRGGRSARYALDGRPFQVSKLVEGYRAHDLLHDRKPCSVLRALSINHHKILFSLVYGHELDTDFESDWDAVYTLTEVTALAEYYLLLPVVAAPIAAYLEDVPSIWSEIAKNATYWLLVGEKIRSFKIFSEALRHVVGRSIAYQDRMDDRSLGSSVEDLRIFRLIFLKQQELRHTIDGLTRALRAMTLSPYQANEHKIRRKRVQETPTTWMAAGLEKKSLADKCKFIAGSVFREKLDALIFGVSHWSHVEYVRNGRKGGEVEAGSLFIACNALLSASRATYQLDIFGKRISRQFASVFNLGRSASKDEDPARMIADELKRLLHRAVRNIKYWVPAHGETAYTAYRSGDPARCTQGVEYFTNLYLENSDMPWHEEIEYEEVEDEEGGWLETVAKPWQDFEMGVEVEEASQEWVSLIRGEAEGEGDAFICANVVGEESSTSAPGRSAW